MNTRKFGNSDMNITPIGFGAWAIGGPDWQFGWGEQNEGESIAAIHRALELGINWIDTAAAYGLGHSEEVVAKALDAWSGPRPYVFTKCGIIWDADRKIGFSLREQSIRRECEASLRRLRVETIDYYQIHWPASHWPSDIDETLEGWATMAKLKQEGKVRWIGVCNFNLEELQRSQEIAPVTALQPPYSLIRREIEAEVLPWCEKNGVGVIAYSPMASGLLTGAMTRERAAALPENDWRSRNPEFKEPKLTQNLALVERLAAVGKRHGVSPGEAAIAWALRNSVMTGAIVGARSAKQVEGVVGAAALKLTGAEIAEIEG
ncbi:MAG TPA: aldo/keto reductase [Chthoniobacteraceae bacterium]|nr:aldo/keto reductase [Chthoniobacteraceae bacterium]